MFKLFIPLLIAVLFIASCGSKTDDTTKTQDTLKILTNTQTTADTNALQADTTGSNLKEKAAEQTKLDAEKKKADELKKKEEADKKKKEEEKKKKEEEKKEELEKSKDESVGKVNFSAIWQKRCIKCHGSNGKGKVEGVPDLTASKTQSKSNSQLFNIISNGVKGETEDDEDMPSFKSKLTEEEINAAIEFVKGL